MVTSSYVSVRLRKFTGHQLYCYNKIMFDPKILVLHLSLLYCVLVEAQNGRYSISRPLVQRQTWRQPTFSPVSTLDPEVADVSVIAQSPVNHLYDYMCQESNGYSSVPPHCDKYVECKENVPIQYSCPDGLHFNPNAQWPEDPCEYPSNVRCISETHIEEADNSRFITRRPVVQRQPWSWSMLKQTAYPTAYPTKYPTIYSTTAKVITEAPQTTSYSEQNHVVIPNKPWYAESTITPMTPEITQRSLNYVYDHVCKASNCYSPIPQHCDKYVECQENVPIRFSCPEGLHFNPNVQWPEDPCEHPSNVNCIHSKTAIVEADNSRFTTRRPVVQRQPLIRSTLPPTIYPTTATVITRAPQSTSYGRQKYVTIPNKPWYAETTVTPTRPPVTPGITHRSVNQIHNHVCKTSNSYSPVPPHCDKYVECKNNVPAQYTCPGGLHFNPNAQWPENPCDYPSNVGYVSGTVVAEADKGRFSTGRSIVQRKPWSTLTPTIYPKNVVTKAPQSTSYGSQTSVLPTYAKRLLTPTGQSVASESSQRYGSQPYDNYCEQPNYYYSVPSQCDSYVECKDSVATQLTCPAGLEFNSISQWPEYPCKYPSDVKCISELAVNSESTADCPLPYGFFPPESGDCGTYLLCEEGIAKLMKCPPGLGFNYDKNSCDWPIEIPGCNPEALEGFTCPAPPEDEQDHIFKYKYGNSCSQYVACQGGHPRLLSCDAGYSFDEASEVCVDSEYVVDCVA